MSKNNNELAAKVAAPAGKKTVLGFLENCKDQIQAALPEHLSLERMIRLTLTELRTTPKLLSCTQESLLAGVMRAAQDGLEFGTGQCHLVPFWNGKKNANEATYIRGYQGCLQLVRNSGQLLSISAEVVYENDTFEYEKGFEEKLRHVPAFEKRGNVKLFYAYAMLKDGGRAAVVMTKDEVTAIRNRSKAKNNGPWVTDEIEMSKKTVLKRLCKYLPIAFQVRQAFREEEEQEFNEKRQAIDISFDAIEGNTSEQEQEQKTKAIEQREEPQTIELNQTEREKVAVKKTKPTKEGVVNSWESQDE